MTTSTQRVNYDLIAHIYDEPGRDYDVDPWLIRFIENKSDQNIRLLDLGCGTGKQLAANRSRFPGIPMVGLDLFQGMLHQAQHRSSGIHWVQGDNVHLPFEDNSFNYITNQFSYHHVQDKTMFFSEVYRVLTLSGRFVITNLSPWSMENWIVYKYFPAARQRDFSDFLSAEELENCLHQAGFGNLQFEQRHTHHRESLGSFLKYASQRYRTSQLLAIPDDDYNRGIAAIQQSIKDHGKSYEESSELCLVWIAGDKL